MTNDQFPISNKFSNLKFQLGNWLLVFGTCLYLVSCILVIPAFAWKITPELKQEIAEKQLEVRLFPNNPHTHFDLAITYAYSNRIEEGYVELKKANDLDKNYAPRVIKMYQDAVLDDPNDWKLHFRLAFGYYFGGRKKEAVSEFEKVIQLDPNNLFAYGFIGTIYADLNDFKKGTENVRKALKIDSNVAVLHFLMAQAYFHDGKKSEGIAESIETLRLKALGY